MLGVICYHIQSVAHSHKSFSWQKRRKSAFPFSTDLSRQRTGRQAHHHSNQSAFSNESLNTLLTICSMWSVVRCDCGGIICTYVSQGRSDRADTSALPTSSKRGRLVSFAIIAKNFCWCQIKNMLKKSDDFFIRPPGEFLPVGSLQGKLKEKPHFFESLPRLKRNKVVLFLLLVKSMVMDVNMAYLWFQFTETLGGDGRTFELLHEAKQTFLKNKNYFFPQVEKAYRGMEKAVVKLNTKFHWEALALWSAKNCRLIFWGNPQWRNQHSERKLLQFLPFSHNSSQIPQISPQIPQIVSQNNFGSYHGRQFQDSEVGGDIPVA